MKLRLLLVVLLMNIYTVAKAADNLSIIDIIEPASINEVIRKHDGIYVGKNHVHHDKHATLQFDRSGEKVGKIQLKNYPKKEYVRLLSGRVVITNPDGTKKEFKKGQAFVIPKGFSGELDVQEEMTKEFIKISESLLKSKK